MKNPWALSWKFEHLGKFQQENSLVISTSNSKWSCSICHFKIMLSKPKPRKQQSILWTSTIINHDINNKCEHNTLSNTTYSLEFWIVNTTVRRGQYHSVALKVLQTSFLILLFFWNIFYEYILIILPLSGLLHTQMISQAFVFFMGNAPSQLFFWQR